MNAWRFDTFTPRSTGLVCERGGGCVFLSPHGFIELDQLQDMLESMTEMSVVVCVSIQNWRKEGEGGPGCLLSAAHRRSPQASKQANQPALSHTRMRRPTEQQQARQASTHLQTESTHCPGMGLTSLAVATTAFHALGSQGPRPTWTASVTHMLPWHRPCLKQFLGSKTTTGILSM